MVNLETHTEEWRPVVGYEGLYEVSNRGRVRNSKGLIIAPMKDMKGYPKVNIYRNKIMHQIAIHRLVCQSFLVNPNNYPQVNHINGIKNDNRIENLEWCTPKQNSQHAVYVIKTSQKHRKEVAKCTMSGEVIETYPSMRLAAKLNNTNGPHIKGNLIGKVKHINNFIWKIV